MKPVITRGGGRPAKLNKYEVQRAHDRYVNDGMTQEGLAKELGVGLRTISDVLKLRGHYACYRD